MPVRTHGWDAALVLVVCVVLVLAILVVGGGPALAAGDANTGTLVTMSTSFGADLTQVSADPWRNPQAVTAAEAVVSQSARYVEQPIMGWGADNPEPSPGHYNWKSLDARMKFIATTGAIPVITLAGAPDWMKGGQAGQTDWQNINVAPLPQYDQAFAHLAAKVAKRYPQVHYFQVWSELKGYWDPTANNWDAAAYTTMYNDVYQAIKAVEPAAQIGGPYVDMVTWGAATAGGHPSDLTGAWGTIDQRSLDVVSYWLAHAVGAQFVAVDGSINPKDNDGPADPGAATAMFAAIDGWLKLQTSLPIWWSEWYVGVPGVHAHHQEWLALGVAALLQMTTSGAAVALVWDPQRYSGSHSPGLWTSTATATGGRPTALAGVQALLDSDFPPGRSAKVGGTAGEQWLQTGSARLVVNASPTTVTSGPPGHRVHLGPWQVTLHPPG